MFKKKCPKCGAKNDKARTACIECSAPFLLEEERTRDRGEEASAGLETEKAYEAVKTKYEQASVEIIRYYNRRKVQLTDRSIRIERLFPSSEIPYQSVKGCMFRSCSNRSFECKFRYMTEDGKEKEITAAKTDDDEAYRLNAHILKICKNSGQEIEQYPCPAMIFLREKLESFGLECKFLEPDVDTYELLDYPQIKEWQIDLGGYALENPFIKEVLVQERGRSEYTYHYYLTGTAGAPYSWDSERKYDFDYVIRDPQIHQIDCSGNLEKKFGLSLLAPSAIVTP